MHKKKESVMKKILSLALALILSLSLLGGLTSCSGKDDNGAVVNAYYVGEMYNFDPAAAATDDDAMRVLSLLYEPLFNLNERGKVVPALAKSYEIIEDEEKGIYKMEITLKETYWSDGSRVKADDVAYAWQRIIDCSFKSQAAPLLYDIKGAVEVKKGDLSSPEGDFGVTVENAELLTIEFVGKIDYDAFLRNLTSVALAPVPESVVSKAEDYWAKRSVTVVTNGPFTVSTLDLVLGEFTIARNAYYRRSEEADPSTLKKFVTPYEIRTEWPVEKEFTFPRAAASQAYLDYVAELETKFADKALFLMSDMPLSLRESMEKKAEVKNVMSTYSLLVNTNSQLLKNKNLRLALSAAIDRQAIADLLTFAVPATGFISHGVFDSTTMKKEFREVGGELISPSADEEAVSRYLAVPGTPKSGTIRLACHNTEADTAVANYLKTVWDAMGYNVIIKTLAGKGEIVYPDPTNITVSYSITSSLMQEAYDSFKAGGTEYDLLLVDYQMYSPDAFTPLCGFTTELNGNGMDISVNEDAPDGEANRNNTIYRHVTGFSNTAYDKLLLDAYQEKDLAKRAEILHDAEELLLGEMPIIPLTFGQSYYVAGRGIRDISTTYYGYPVLTKMSLRGYQKYLPVADTEAEEAEETE